MSSEDGNVPETRVLAIASHVVYGYVGNTMATLVMQSLGCEVAALNTVQFSNHTGYGQFRGSKTTAAEITALYEGLVQSGLNDDFDVLLTGYIPGAEAVQAVGAIAKDLIRKSKSKSPGGFFWVLDPVMGDEGQLYVDSAVVPAYKSLLSHANLILPNQFEAETLSDRPITSLETLATALHILHKTYGIPHIIITSVRFPCSTSPTETISVIGSTATSAFVPRIFSVSVPAISCFFSGTGDMFAALTVCRLREAVAAVPGLSHKHGWVSDDDVAAMELPLCVAVEKVLGSMQKILGKTRLERDRILDGYTEAQLEGQAGRVVKSKASEVRLVRNLADLHPSKDDIYPAVEVRIGAT